jgi:glycogen operon protein
MLPGLFDPELPDLELPSSASSGSDYTVSRLNQQVQAALEAAFPSSVWLIGEVSGRMTGSADVFNHDGRCPRASVNHVTVHDGFTLADLVSYAGKHNEANGEDNRDGADDNASTNCGAEGPTDDPKIVALRQQLRRNQLACLLLAEGVPLILAGDEVGNSQGGNNNAYCQDNPTGWVDWSGLGRPGADLTAFVGQLASLRRAYPQLRLRHWVQGRRADGSFGVLWLTPAASEMTEQDWKFPDGRFLAYVLGPVEPGQPALFIVLNAAPEPITASFPKLPEYGRWLAVLDTVRRGQVQRRARPRRKPAGAAAWRTCVLGRAMTSPRSSGRC